MEKFKKFYQKIIHSPKSLLLIGLFFLSFSFVVFLMISSKPQKALFQPTVPLITPKTKVFTGPIIQKEPFPTPSINIRWSEQEFFSPTTLKIYSTSRPLVSSQNAIFFAQKLGFEKNNQQEIFDENFISWQKNDSSLSLNFTDNELVFSSNISPQVSNQNYNEESYLLASNNYLQNIFGETFLKSLVKQNVTYHKLQGSNTILSSIKEATLVRISFYQKINGHPVTTISETGAIVSLFLDKNLNLKNLSVKDAFTETVSLGEFKIIPLSDLINSANSIVLRINASPYQDIAADTASVKNIIFNQKTVQIAYLVHQKQLLPVYLLEGIVRAGNLPEQIGLYILPATTD